MIPEHRAFLSAILGDYLCLDVQYFAASSVLWSIMRIQEGHSTQQGAQTR